MTQLSYPIHSLNYRFKIRRGDLRLLMCFDSPELFYWGSCQETFTLFIQEHPQLDNSLELVLHWFLNGFSRMLQFR
jgi:hypothetical protein